MGFMKKKKARRAAKLQAKGLTEDLKHVAAPAEPVVVKAKKPVAVKAEAQETPKRRWGRKKG